MRCGIADEASIDFRCLKSERRCPNLVFRSDSHYRMSECRANSPELSTVRSFILPFRIYRDCAAGAVHARTKWRLPTALLPKGLIRPVSAIGKRYVMTAGMKFQYQTIAV